MTILVCVVLAAVVAAMAAVATRGVFSAEACRATNFRGRSLAVGVGVLVPFSALLADALLTVGDRAHRGSGSVGLRLVVVA